MDDLDLREEHGVFIYRDEPCNSGTIRKMLVLLPAVHPLGLNSDELQVYNDTVHLAHTIFKFAADNPDLQFS